MPGSPISCINAFQVSVPVSKSARRGAAVRRRHGVVRGSKRIYLGNKYDKFLLLLSTSRGLTQKLVRGLNTYVLTHMLGKPTNTYFSQLCVSCQSTKFVAKNQNFQVRQYFYNRSRQPCLFRPFLPTSHISPGNCTACIGSWLFRSLGILALCPQPKSNLTTCPLAFMNGDSQLSYIYLCL